MLVLFLVCVGWRCVSPRPTFVKFSLCICVELPVKLDSSYFRLSGVGVRAAGRTDVSGFITVSRLDMI